MDLKQPNKAKRNNYWYLLHIGECWECGHRVIERERITDRPKPAHRDDRESRYRRHCGCLEAT